MRDNSNCIMALLTEGDVLKSPGLRWKNEVALFHKDNYGKNIQLLEDCAIAYRQNTHHKWGYGMVCSSEPLPVGKMLRVTILESLSVNGGLGVGLTTNIVGLSSMLEMPSFIPDAYFVRLDGLCLNYQQPLLKETSQQIDFCTYDLKKGQTLGILLTRQRCLHWFVDGMWRGCYQLPGFPLDQSIWGLADVCASCKIASAKILSVCGYDQSHHEQLLRMGLIEQHGSRLSRLIVQQKATMEQIETEVEQLQLKLRQRREAFEVVQCQQQALEFWQVSFEEVSIKEDQVIDRGAWGYTTRGTFRGTNVAIKRVYPEILRGTTVDRIRQELRMMAQVRHPNLVLFIAAVLNEQTGPIIITELLDTSLREAYQANLIGTSKQRILIDIASALSYLHAQSEPIIHRDVSTANVLLLSTQNNSWRAKLSNFGSANLARCAATLGQGAIVYTAPEAFPQHQTYFAQPPSRQTVKIDVYGFGILACELITRKFPGANKLPNLVDAVRHVWPAIHQLVCACISIVAEERPTMLFVLSELKNLAAEPQ